MKIAIASDHAGYEFKKKLIEWLNSKKYEILDFGTFTGESVDYPDYAVQAAEAIVTGKVDNAILICGTGIGMSITANKIRGIRAANCTSVEMAHQARLHNNANVLTLGARITDIDLAKEIVVEFLETEFEGGRHIRRIEKIHSLTGR